jgi:hypothetical protein
MGSASEWLAEIERRGDEFLAARDAMHREVGERIRRELAPSVRVAVRPIVIEGPEDVEVDEAGGGRRVPAAATRIRLAAVGVGWVPRVVRAVAAVPGKGIVESWSVRCRRHDERLVAVWATTTRVVAPTGITGLDVGAGVALSTATSLDLAAYVGPLSGGHIELLGMETVEQRAGAIANWANTKSGQTGKPPPRPLIRRGLLDAINGVRLPSA